MNVIISSIDEYNETAVVLTEDNRFVGANLWQIAGYTRHWDGYFTAEYIPI